jgi:hypothetical protein
MDLLGAGSRKESEDRANRVQPGGAAEGLPRRHLVGAIEEGMAHEDGIPPDPRKISSSKGRMTAMRSACSASAPRPPGLPGPDLGSDVVEYRGPRAWDLRHAEIETGIIDGKNQVHSLVGQQRVGAVAPGARRRGDGGEPPRSPSPPAGPDPQAADTLAPSARPPSPRRAASGNRLRIALATPAPWRSPEASPASMRTTGRLRHHRSRSASKSDRVAEVPDDEITSAMRRR